MLPHVHIFRILGQTIRLVGSYDAAVDYAYEQRMHLLVCPAHTVHERFIWIKIHETLIAQREQYLMSKELTDGPSS